MGQILTVSDLEKQEKLHFQFGKYNIIQCGVRTGKTYWAMHNLTKYTRDGDPHRILFLVDTLSLKDAIISKYSDLCVDADEEWRRPENQWWNETNKGKIGVMCYQALGARVIKEDVHFLQSIDVICWDECDSIFDFAASSFVSARKTDFAKKFVSNNEILSIIQQYSTKNEYMSLILLGYWERLVNEGRILCVGLSATPERALRYYEGLTSASNQGKLETAFRASCDIYYRDGLELIRSLHPEPGVAYFMYSPYISVNKSYVPAAEQQGFNVIEMHSPNNKEHPMSEEQLRVADMMLTLHMIPYEYDFVIVNKAFQRGFDLLDSRFRYLIVDSFRHEDREQAGRQVFPYQRYVKTFSDAVPESYKNKWLTVPECRELATEMNVSDVDLKGDAHGKVRSIRPMTWNKLQKFLEAEGYTIEKARKRVNGNPNPQNCYRITGEWHDIELVGDNDFLQLVEAKSSQNQGG